MAYRWLCQQWQTLAHSLGLPAAKAQVVREKLFGMYLEPSRHYHNLLHIAAMLKGAQALPSALALLLAIWFHDCIYRPGNHDNEERSAQCMLDILDGVGAEVLLEAKRLILLTKTHLPAADDTLGKQLIDLDLMVLGANHEVYAHYSHCIRKEHAKYPAVVYNYGRKKVLKALLAKQRLFHTDAMAHLEAPARFNLKTELDNY